MAPVSFGNWFLLFKYYELYIPAKRNSFTLHVKGLTHYNEWTKLMECTQLHIRYYNRLYCWICAKVNNTMVNLTYMNKAKIVKLIWCRQHYKTRCIWQKSPIRTCPKMNIAIAVALALGVFVAGKTTFVDKIMTFYCNLLFWRKSYTCIMKIRHIK